ncbi:MAG: GIY-YIG nuclease family protein [Candidatus Udaeobacter sp.]
MFYVYVLQSADGKSLYYGFSSNLKQRIRRSIAAGLESAG